MRRGQIFWSALMIALVAGGTILNFREMDLEAGRREAHANQVLSCRAEQYEAYQYMVGLGMNRWSAACSKAVPLGQAERQCFIRLKDCGK